MTRTEIAVKVLVAMMATGSSNKQDKVRAAVEYADLLIEALKGNP